MGQNNGLRLCLALNYPYIRNFIFVKDNKARCHWRSAEGSKSLRLKWTSLDIRWCKFCASTTFNNRLVISSWRKPKVIINIGRFSSGTEGSAYTFFINFFFGVYANIVVFKFKKKTTLSSSNLSLPCSWYSSKLSLNLELSPK